MVTWQQHDQAGL